MARDNKRDLRDQELLASIALPNAAASASTPWIDLGYDDPSQRRVEFPELTAKTTQATGVDAHSLVITIEDSANGVSGAVAVGGLGTQAIPSVSNSYPASEFRWKLPRTVRRYIRATVANPAGGGNATNGSIELSLRF